MTRAFPRLAKSLCDHFWFEPVDDNTLNIQASLIRENFTVAYYAVIAGAWLLVSAQQALMEDGDLLIWGVIYTLLSLTAIGFVRRPGLRAPRRLAGEITLWTTINGLLWAVLAVLIIRHQHGEALLLYVAFITTVTGGALALTSTYLPAFLGFMIPPVLAITFSINFFSSEDSPVLVTRGVGILIYMVAVWFFAARINKTTKEGILLRFENDQLVADLQKQTSAAEAARVIAEEADRAKSKFLAAASHDLRQPIHAISLFLDAMDRSNLTEAQSGVLANVRSATRSCQDLLKTLLDFSRIEAGVVHSNPISFPLQPLLYQLFNEFGGQADETGLVLRLRDTSLWARVDPLLCELILRNLLTNAVRYTPGGGIFIGVRQRRRAHEAVIEIWDTGVGIDAHDQQNIFREFYQVDNPERDKAKGLGLGLAIVSGLCRTMGVRVSLRSKVGRGTVFRLHLPLSRSQPEKIGIEMKSDGIPARDNIKGDRFKTLRVLVVDDNESVQQGMRQLFANYNLSCKTAGSAEAALALLDEWEPNLLISDYRLRGHTTGGDVINRLRQRLGPEIPAIIITGDTSPERLRDASSLNAALLHKPLTAEQLFDTIERVYA